MKLAGILKSTFVCVAALLLWSCDNKLPKAEETLNENLSFILKEDAVYLQTASIRVKHNGPESTQWVYMNTSDLTTDADQLIADRVKIESELTDQIVSQNKTNVSLNLKNLEEKQTYRLIVKGIDPKSGRLYGKVAELVFKTRRDPDVWEENTNWAVTRRAERTQGIAEGSSEVIEFENFECSSSDEESYIILTLSKADYDAYKKDEAHKDKIRTIFEDYHSDMSASDGYEDMILKGNGVWKEQRLRSGDYVVFMIGVDEDGELSGLYKRADIAIAQETPIEEYNKWLGWWEISFSDSSAPWNVYIDDLDANMWYLSQGWEPEAISEQVYNMGLKLYFDKSSGKIYFTSQEVAVSEDGGIRVFYYGTFPYGTYQTVLDLVNVRVAEAKFTDTAGTQAKISPLTVNLAGVDPVPFTNSIFYISYGSQSSTGASGKVPSFPWTMKKLQ